MAHGRLGCLALVVTLLGCAATLPPPAPRLELLPDADVAEPPTPPATLQAFIPVEELTRLQASEPPHPAENPLTVITEANTRAAVLPTRGRFDGSIWRIPHVPGHLYQLTVGVDAPLTLIIPAGEEYLMSGGLDARWLLKIPETRTPGSDMHLLLIAPEPKLKGRLTLVTSKAAYMMEVRSQEKPGLVAVAWQLPSPQVPAARETFLAAGEYRTGYEVTVEAGQPIWTPASTQIWDVPRRGKTLIRFPDELQTTEAPVLYVLGPDGEKQLTNYRIRGAWYEVDRRFERGELRLGHDAHAEVVTITRGAGYQAFRCPGDTRCPPEVTR